MSREAFWSMVLLIGGGLAIAVIQLARSEEVGAQYVLAEQVEPEAAAGWTIFRGVPQSAQNEPGVSFSLPRSIGIWIGALLTLAVFSFLAGDNPAYKLAESIFVGVSAGYVMVAGFWDQIVQNLMARLLPDVSSALGVANLDGSIEQREWIYLVPLALSVMMLWQLSPKGGWIARWPLAFFIGATAGIRITATFESDFIRQIQQTLLPLVAIVYDNTASGRSVDWVASLQQSVRNTIIVFGVLTSLTYFFFSVEHRGAVRVASRIGVFVLMITFGAAFGFTVMGRIVLLTQRLEFLFFEWLRFSMPT
ncbi:MAG: hypothetical protein H0T47_24250 [Planctomycetaceae bacterium]|nr:hypothetical protein [Planctomycetaceae bacterium]